MRKIYVGGTFDMFHAGHKELLDDARKIVGLEGKIIVAVNSDEFVKQYKGITPAWDEANRGWAIQDYLRGTNHLIYIVSYHQQADLLSQTQPDFVLHGTDWTGPDLAKNFGVDYDWFTERGILFVYTDRRAGVSSTQLREKL